jgi:hypothetical protein
MLTNTAAKKLSTNPVAVTLIEVYGVTAIHAEPISIEWAADRVMSALGAERVAAALREVNRIRVSLGRSPAYPRFGTALFGV